jgi:hypothetical protein
MLQAGQQAAIYRGNIKIGIRKGSGMWEVIEVTPLGKDYGHEIKVRLKQGGIVKTLYARHKNLLMEYLIPLRCGDGINRIIIFNPLFAPKE